MSIIQIGILALQGDFKEHKQALTNLGIDNIEVRLPKDLIHIQGLILPGGESTTILKLMQMYKLYDKLKSMGKNGFPMYGTCAGTIVLSRKSNLLKVDPLGLIDIGVERNAYGSQKFSFEEHIYFDKMQVNVPGIFIRAPRITEVGDGVEVLARTEAGDPVIAQDGNILVSTFHPELSESLDVHRYFVEKLVELS
jgi:pyridoxal 5'-phosphate synthase pdxT subunit